MLNFRNRSFSPEGGGGAPIVTDPGLKTFFETTADPMALVDADLKIMVANPAAGRFLGMLPKHLRGTPVLEVAVLARILTAASVPQRLRAGEEAVISDDVSLTDSEGQPIQCHLEAVPLGDGRTLIHLQNTTPVLRARAQLQQAEQLHRAIFEALPGVAWTMALPEERLVDISPAVERMFGYQPAAFHQRPELWDEVVHPAERERVRAEFRIGVESRRPFQIEFTGVHRDHRDLPHLVNHVVPVRDDNGWVDHCEGFIEDVSRVVNLEADQRALRSNLRHILDAVASGVLVARPGPHGPEVAVCNRRLAELLRLDEPLKPGTPLSQATPELRRLVYGDGTAFEFERHVLSEDVREEVAEFDQPQRVLRSFAGPLRDEHGGVIGRIVTVEDITSTWSMQRRLTNAQKMESMGRLAGGVSHDFNNLLGTILGFSTLLLEQMPNDDPRHGSLEQIAGAAERASRLTQALLAFSRSARFERLPVHLNRVVEDTYQIVRASLEPSVAIVMQLEPELPLLLGDALLLQQVLVNLVQEARPRLEPGGRLAIATRLIEQPRPGELPHEGPEAQHAIVLELHVTPGQPAAPPRPVQPAGDRAGMAMTIVEDIARAHGGYVVTPPASGAAAYQVVFPVDTPDEAPVLVPEAATARGHETILVVDDEPGLRSLAKIGLQQCGFDVITVESGEQALEILRKGDPRVDIVLLDLTLPGMSGEKVLRSIRSFLPALPVIIASGYATVESQSSWMAAGAMGFVAKPYRIQQVAQKVREVLDRARPDAPERGAGPPPSPPAAGGESAGPASAAGASDPAGQPGPGEAPGLH
ncbi:MAG TPA: response regulator [Candidatus Eisenbacteria bacterium]|nr:response regulator [Candidatus Eisenbacteria bacterium]